MAPGKSRALGFRWQEPEFVADCKERTAACVQESKRLLAEADRVLRSVRLIPRSPNTGESEAK